MKQLVGGIFVIILVCSIGIGIKGEINGFDGLALALFSLVALIIAAPLFLGAIYLLVCVSTFWNQPMSERRKIAKEMDDEYNKRYKSK